MPINPEIDEAASELFYQLTAGIDPKSEPLANRNSRALCLLLATLRDQGLITDLGIDNIITTTLR